MVYLTVAQNRIKRQRLHFLGKLGRINIQPFDFSFDVLFLVGQELVNFPISLDERVALEERECLFDLAPLSGLIGVKLG